MPDDAIFDSLTPNQRQAVEHIDGPLLILAGPGSGKTRVVTHRIANLLAHGVPSRQILALTFTNKAADEMRSRLDRLVPREPVWMGTFHRFCARLLRMHANLVGLSENYTIYDTEDSAKALRSAIEESDVPLELFTPDAVRHAISAAKNCLITADAYEPNRGNALGSVVARLYPLYQQRLLRSNAVDFDDLLMHVALLLRENPELRSSLDERYRYILVDEYQDTNLAQYAIVRGLSIDHPNLSVTGDPDQSIYGWRGANIKNILEFERNYPDVKVVRLEQNYRSTKNILRVADKLIRHNVQRKEKGLYTENDQGRPVRLIVYPTNRDEAESIATRIAADIHSERRKASDFAIFYRLNALSRSLEESLRAHGVPYQIVSGVEFFQRKEIKDILAYLQLMSNASNDVAFLRVVNNPPRGIGKTTLLRLAEHANQYRIPLLEAAREAGMIEALNKRAAVALAKFVSLYDQLGVVVHAPVEEILGHVLTHSTYREYLENSPNEEDDQRLANVEELLTVARDFDREHPGSSQLEVFLEQLSLVNETDNLEDNAERVKLMTMHAAKGLEFPVVFIVAVEEGILPHERSRQHPKQLEEERRLLFVGITRAEQELDISYAQQRDFRGSRRLTVPSQFLVELPKDEMEVVEPNRFAYGTRQQSTWSNHDCQDHLPADEDYFQADAEPGDDVSQEEEELYTGPIIARGIGLRTAAEMLPEEPSPVERVSPDLFSHGMMVKHPSYGLGKIVALSGSADKRTATVAFIAPRSQRQFRLDKSPLRPVKSP